MAQNDNLGSAGLGETCSEGWMWEALVSRDKDADGSFVYAVITTGVFCRPSCPSRLPLRRNVEFYLRADQAVTAGFRACKKCNPAGPRERHPPSQTSQTPGLTPAEQAEMKDALAEQGWWVRRKLLSSTQCSALMETYADDDLFRSTIDMERYAFGKGRYRYFHYPLPEFVSRLRATFYPPLAAIANDWRESMGLAGAFPKSHKDFIEACRKAGQERPTPLILRYEQGGYNCLHQDLYGETVFPIQMAVLLSRQGEDFEGGEFVLTEQRPRMQSIAHVVPLEQGDAVFFAVNERPKQGKRGFYRVKMRHGVSKIRMGERYALGVIFHDAQ